MKKKLDVILVEGTDKIEFINSFDPETEADWWNMLENIPNLISMNVEESFIEEFKKDSRILHVDERLEVFPASIPSPYIKTKNITAVNPSTTEKGSDYSPLQFYLDTNQIYSSEKVGSNVWFDQRSTIPNATYRSKWTGKNVDIVSLEVDDSSRYSISTNSFMHLNHPDFRDIDNPETSKIIPMNWEGLETSSNRQVSSLLISRFLLTEHATGVLSAASGTICGFAKRSNLRVVYANSNDDVVECIDSIINWHNNKPINPETGVKNPTIMIGEYQYLLDRKTCIKIDDIVSITDLYGTVNRPGNTWGSDFTPFVDRNIIPFKVFDDDLSEYFWCVVFPLQGRNITLQESIKSAWDSGIVCINAAGNNGGVYVKTSDQRYTGVYCRTDSDIVNIYDIGNGIYPEKSISEGRTIWYPFVSYGPHGEDKSIDVAAGYNSEANSILDAYTNRGPGIDIVGLGENTWTAYNGGNSRRYADRNYWGMFGGTSCAAPTVAGKAACIMERYFAYKNVWPTPDQVKTLLISTAKKVVRGVKTTSWENVPDPNGNIDTKESGNSLLQISRARGSNNGSYKFSDLCETTNLRAFFDAEEFNSRNTEGKRPNNGLAYPRRKLRIGDAKMEETNSTPIS